MAVFEQRYRAWDGARTSPARRLLVLPRYAYRDIFSSRLFTGLYVASFAVPLGCAVAVWALNNAPLMARLSVRPEDRLDIGPAFFLWMLGVQLVFAAAQAVVVVPALVSPDLVNGALPLYLSRPVSRAQYVAGKFAVLSILLSTITWVPGVLLFGLESSLSASPWAFSHLRILLGLVAGSLLGISVLGFLGLAVSAFVKRRAIARGVFVAFLVITAAMGEILNDALATTYGSMLNVFLSMETVCAWLVGYEKVTTPAFPVPAAAAGLLLLSGASLLLLRRRLRAVEVVA